MKKLLLLTLFIGLLSCSGDSDSNTDQNANNQDQSACPKPESLWVSTQTMTTTTADLYWYQPGSSTLFYIEYGPLGFSKGSGTVISAGSSPKYLTGLSPNTAYDFYVRANCGGDVYSEWTGPHSFTTN